MTAVTPLHMTTTNEVTIDSTVLQALIKTAHTSKQPPIPAIATATKTLANQSETNELPDTLFTDELYEKYGYSVYNTHTNSFMTLPKDKSGGSHPHSNHVMATFDKHVLQKLQEQYALDSVQHLRIVTVHLSNTHDETAARICTE